MSYDIIYRGGMYQDRIFIFLQMSFTTHKKFPKAKNFQ